MSCGLFVAEVRGSRSCAVCKRHLRDHKPDAIYVEPRRIFPNLPGSPKQEPKSMSSLATSHHSAFTPYARPVVHNNLGPSTSSSAQSFRDPPPLIRPLPRLAVPVTLPQEERSDSCIYKKIHGRQKERSSSVGELRSPSDDEDETEKRSSLRSSPLPTQRANDFRKILQRFQSADQPSQPGRRFTVDTVRITNNNNNNNNNEDPFEPAISDQIGQIAARMSPIAAPNESWGPRILPREAWSPTRTSSAPRDSWSPAQRSSINSAYRSSPVSRNTSGRSRMSVSSMQSPISFLATRECSPRSVPSPSLVPMRVRCSSDEQNGTSTDSHSPLSHTGSTPEPPPVTVRRAPLAVQVPTPKRRSLPGRWIKETDIDAPGSLPMSPLNSPSIEGYSSEDILHPANSNQRLNKAPSLEAGLRPKPTGRYGGSCCRVLSGLEQNNKGSPNGVYVRRSRSKDEKSFNGQMHAVPAKSFTGSTGSISQGTLHTIPIFMSSESVLGNHRNTSISPPSSQENDAYKHYQQIALSHVQTLSTVADRLADDMRHGEEPVSRNRLSSLDFSHFVVQPQPVLTKGKSLFYNAVLPRQGQSDYPVTLMIAPCSQYAPLMRRADSQLFAAPSFLEMEDHDGSIRRFLADTETHNLDGRNTKAVAMPRLNLCSFHSLAAHHLNERMERSSHEELVCFILLQLLAALKMLQSEGVEALSANFKEFLLAYRFSPMDSQSQMREFPRLIFLADTLGAEVESGGDELVGLCRYALRALCTLLHHRMDGRAPPIKLRSRFSRALQACANLLLQDKSSSLTKAKNVLELALWWTGDAPRTEKDCRRSIDIARAEAVDSLVRQLVCEPGCLLGARERLRVEFLLGATPRSLIDSQNAILAANVS